MREKGGVREKVGVRERGLNEGEVGGDSLIPRPPSGGSGLGMRLGMRERGGMWEWASLLGFQAFATPSLLLFAVCKYEGAGLGDLVTCYDVR